MSTKMDLEGSQNNSNENLVEYTGNKGPRFGKRHIQILVTSFGIGIITATKNMFQLAIVSMTDRNSTSNDDVPIYDWNNKGTILSAMSWSTIPIQILAGYLGKRYGAKWFLLLAVFVNGVAFIFIPLAAATTGSVGVIICRVVQGMAEGLWGPIGGGFNALWAPVEERARLGYVAVIVTTLFSSLAVLITAVIANSSLGWPWSFYIFALSGFVWCLCWAFIGQENPSVHSSITSEEKTYILTSLGQKKVNHSESVQWMKYLKNIHVWAVTVAAVGSGFMNSLMSTILSLFFTNILKFKTDESAIIGMVPVLIAVFIAGVLAFLSDFIVKRKILRLVNSRRVFQTVGTVGVSLSLIAVTYIPERQMIVTIIGSTVLYIFLVGSAVGGSQLTPSDMSPESAGIIKSIADTFSNGIALFAPLTYQWIVGDDDQNASKWRLMFIIAEILYIVTTIFYDIFATDKRHSFDKNFNECEHEEKK